MFFLLLCEYIIIGLWIIINKKEIEIFGKIAGINISSAILLEILQECYYQLLSVW
jgi:hypothetical protein